jgi:hypothetical protein
MFPTLVSSFRPLVSCLRKPPAYAWAIFGLSVAIPLFFVFTTNQIWEDFFITYRFSENLARGHGLVYSVGERVHGFTSPLNVLLPALFAWLTGARDFLVPLWLYRMVSLAGLLFALLSITSVLTRGHASSRAALLASLFFPIVAVLEIKTTAFALDGQEAGLVLGFLGPAFALACLGWPAHYRLGGVFWAGLMYSRPDAFIYIAALAVAAIAFEPASRRTLGVALFKSGLICAALYLPWLLFAWGYYGSPIPHTIVAKFGIEAYDRTTFGLLAPLAAGLKKAPDVLCWTLSPIYDLLDAGPGTWPRWMHDGAFALALAAVVYWVVPTRDRVGRMASLAAFLLCGYLVYVSTVGQYSPWYYPPLAFLCLLTLVSAIAHLMQNGQSRRVASSAGLLLLSGLLGLLLFEFSSSLRPLRFKQNVIEWGHRRVIGLWLKDHVAQGEAVYLEPLGYIGYFSQCRMLDWPGLVSPEVVAVRRKLSIKTGYTWLEVARALKPAWIVARRKEAEAMQNSGLLRDYELERIFDVDDQITAAGQVPGMRMIYAESSFGVLHRRKPE